MKRNIKKVADLTQKQFEAALSRNGMELTQDGHNPDISTISVYGFELVGKTRRALLADAIAKKDKFDAEEARKAEIRAEMAADVETPDALMPAEVPVAEVPVASDEKRLAEVIYGKESEEAKSFEGNANSMPTREENASRLAEETKAKEEKMVFMSQTVASRYGALVAERGAEVAGTLLQEAIKACGQKIYIDGKVGPYTVRLANRIPEADLLAALNSRAQIGVTEVK